MTPPIIVTEPRHYIGALFLCPHCGQELAVTNVGPQWISAPDPDDGSPNAYVFGRLADGTLCRLWQRG